MAREMQQPQVDQRVRQCNLELGSDLSLTALVNSSGGSLSATAVGRGNAAAPSPPTRSEGVLPHVKDGRRPATSRNTGSCQRGSCGSDTDQVCVSPVSRVKKLLPECIYDQFVCS